MNTFDLGTLDLDKRWRGKTVLMRQGDKSGTVITASLRDHGTALNTSGLTARWQMRLPNGVDYYRRGATYDAGTMSVTIDETTAASVAGETVGYFQVLQGSSVIASTEPVKVVILPDALADAKPSESYDNAIQDAIEALEQATNTIPEKVIAEVDSQLAAHPEWTTTVQDGSITEAKLATDLARDRERLLYRLDNLLTAQLPEGETATASDAAKTPVAGLALYGRSTQAGTPTPSAPVAIQSVEPNLLDPSTFAVRTNSVDIISDGFVSDSTPTADVSGWGWAYRTFEATLPAGTYTVCFCVRKIASAAATYAVMTSSDTVIKEAGNRFEPYTFTLAEATTIGIKIKTYDAVVACMVVEGTVTENPAEYIPYGGITLATVGRNLVDVPDFSRTMSNTYFIEGTKLGGIVMNTCRLEAEQTYTLSMDITSSVEPFIVSVGAGKGAYSMDVVVSGEKRNGHMTVTFTPTAASLARGDVFAFRAPRYTSQTTATYTISNCQLEKGATAHAYEPYASVNIPIPLQGHELRSLPDGTRDEVTVDSRGHAVLVQRVQLTTQAVTDGVTGTVGVDVMSSTGAIANGATVLYKLATPVTIDLGTIDPVPLVGPDLTAQAVPTAPFALTYERDLNAKLARLESAIANLV